MPPREAPQLLKFKAAAARLSVSVRTVQRLVRAHELVCTPVGRRGVRVSEVSLTAYVERDKLAACQLDAAVTPTKSASPCPGMDALNAVFHRELRSGTRGR